jgi:hypothetical protein
MDYQQSIRMARHMKKKDDQIRTAIDKCIEEHHGVVALKFRDQGREMEIEILDEPYDDNVRVYPG